jgi:hypothetical protein
MTFKSILYSIYIRKNGFYRIGALNVFADIGALIDEDEKNQIKFMDLPIDKIQNDILNHLNKDKTINIKIVIQMIIIYNIYYVVNLGCKMY